MFSKKLEKYLSSPCLLTLSPSIDISEITLIQYEKLFPPGASTSLSKDLAKSFHNNLSSNVQLLNIDNSFRDNPSTRCRYFEEGGDTSNFWDDDGYTDYKKKNEVRKITLENIQTNWTGKGAVCFGKNEVWFSAAENLAPGGTPDLVLYICPTSSEKDFCDVDTNGEPNRYNKYLYEIEWSIFGNLTLSRYYFKDKLDVKNGEWIEQ